MKLTVFKTALLVIIGSGFSSAYSAPDPRFTYIGAKMAYESARKDVKINELTDDKWMLIGMATMDRPKEDGYWLDGKFPVFGYPGFFQELNVYTADSNAFGGFFITSVKTVVGAESGKTYDTKTMYGSITSEGVVFEVLADQDPKHCAHTQECRMIDQKSMMLCRLILKEDKRSGCQSAERVSKWSLVDHYSGYIRTPKSPAP